MFDLDPEGGPPIGARDAARKMLQEAAATRVDRTDLVEGWTLTSHAAHPENESDMARLWKTWWEYVEKDAVFFGVPDSGAFVAAQKE